MRITDKVKDGSECAFKTVDELMQYPKGLMLMYYLDYIGLIGDALWDYCRCEYLDNTLALYNDMLDRMYSDKEYLEFNKNRMNGK